MEHLNDNATANKDYNINPLEEIRRKNYFMLCRPAQFVKADRTEKVVRMDCVVYENLTATYWG